jgi:hypothetical protein
MQSLLGCRRLIVPLALMMGVLSACGDDSMMKVELRNHAGATHAFLVSGIQFPELSDYDLITLWSFRAELDHNETAAFELGIPDADDFQGVQSISRVSFSVSVFGTDIDEPLVFPITLAVSGDGTPWLNYVVRDGVFELEQGRD